MPADGMDTKLATEVGKRLGERDWEAYCDSLPGCTDVKNEKGLGTKASDGGENGRFPGRQRRQHWPVPAGGRRPRRAADLRLVSLPRVTERAGPGGWPFARPGAGMRR